MSEGDKQGEVAAPIDYSSPVLLLTGFEPFGKLAINPSWNIAQSLDGHLISRVSIVAAQLPVSWADAWPILLQQIEKVKPRWVIMLGVAGARQVVSVELRATNRNNPLADNKGELPPAEVIAPEEPEYLHSTIPVPVFVERFAEAGVPVEYSSDAGGYLCNWTLYQALLWAQEHDEVDAVGFIHVPPLPDQGGPEISLDSISKGLASAIAALVAGKVPSAEELAGIAEE